MYPHVEHLKTVAAIYARECVKRNIYKCVFFLLCIKNNRKIWPLLLSYHSHRNRALLSSSSSSSVMMKIDAVNERRTREKKVSYVRQQRRRSSTRFRTSYETVTSPEEAKNAFKFPRFPHAWEQSSNSRTAFEAGEKGCKTIALFMLQCSLLHSCRVVGL